MCENEERRTYLAFGDAFTLQEMLFNRQDLTYLKYWITFCDYHIHHYYGAVWSKEH